MKRYSPLMTEYDGNPSVEMYEDTTGDYVYYDDLPAVFTPHDHSKNALPCECCGYDRVSRSLWPCCNCFTTSCYCTNPTKDEV